MWNAEQAAVVEQVDERIAGILEQIQEMSSTLSEEAYFQRVEDFADIARNYLLSIPDPRLRDDLRLLYRQVISYALDLKLGGHC